MCKKTVRTSRAVYHPFEDGGRYKPLVVRWQVIPNLVGPAGYDRSGRERGRARSETGGREAAQKAVAFEARRLGVVKSSSHR